MSLTDLQAQVSLWQAQNWPDETLDVLVKAAKVAEEAGEVCGAVIKHEPLQNVADEHADVLIALLGSAASHGFDLFDVTVERWVSDVRFRGPRSPWTVGATEQ